MPDYDPKDVPTLDDIIEKGLVDNVEPDNAEPDEAEAETEAVAFDINLFLAESNSDTENKVIADTEPQPDDLNGLPDTEPGNTEAEQYVDEETGETSVFISEDTAEDGWDSTGSTLIDNNEDEDRNAIIDVPSDETAQVSVEPIAVELIVKDIVKQLIPELEQQLTLLLQQALEEKLPEEIIKSTDAEHEN